MQEKTNDIRNFRNGHYFQLHNVIIDNYVHIAGRLGKYVLLVYCYLCRCADEQTQTCFPSIRKIAGTLRIRPAKVLAALKFLEKHKLLEIKYGNREVSNYYVLLNPPQKSKTDELNDPIGAKGVSRWKCNKPNTHRSGIPNNKRLSLKYNYEDKQKQQFYEFIASNNANKDK
jgi:DNA-binding MarR family transcriptional regulator